uniref:Uncharacterized protein n=1 Tax=Oryza punctata TaxID=4537 RepID=A0A0G2KBQ2_ORYPU
MCWSKHFLK